MRLEKVLATAHFTIPSRLEYRAAVCHKDGSYRYSRVLSNRSITLNSDQLLVDAVILRIRPSPARNRWRGWVPSKLLRECYTAALLGQMSFVLNAEELTGANPIVVCILEAEDVAKTPSYEKFLQAAMRIDNRIAS